MAFKRESSNEGMERLQERSCGQAARIGRGEGGMGGLSLWAHMLGSLISVQLCPSNATDQHAGCQQTHSSFAEIEMRCFLMDKSSFTVSTCPLSR